MIGVVVIGRNEGERLGQCLKSICVQSQQVVYVDSGSTDDSVSLAKGLGSEVVELDLSIPFTAARARNQGFNRLLALHPNIDFVQFVDGDCEVVNGWLHQAVDFLITHPEVAVVCGRRRERCPQDSVYNRLCDIEWDTPIGETKACGGDALLRATEFAAVGGYRPNLIAGEEPELCVRLRAAGSKVWRLDADMTLHDAAMTNFRQWWKRAVRGGYAYAQGADLHGAPPERHWVRESIRIWAWGLVVPLLALMLLVELGALGLIVLAVYPLQVVRLALKGKRRVPENWTHAFFMVLIKFPELQGQLTFLWRKLIAGKTSLIEYK